LVHREIQQVYNTGSEYLPHQIYHFQHGIH
uniref:IS200/IS605 family transposase n=1 Tax=Brugia timori TaxID=42155 RepID=A0A0R3QUI9_9BILA